MSQDTGVCRLEKSVTSGGINRRFIFYTFFAGGSEDFGVWEAGFTNGYNGARLRCNILFHEKGNPKISTTKEAER